MRIAITGGIAEGKSTVLGLIEETGRRVASADAIARSVFADPEVNRRLAEAAGKRDAISSEDLRQAIASSHAVRRAVNRVMHPRIVGAMLAHEALFFEVPLLVESCLQGLFDQVWVVTCGPEMQRQRLLLRYGDEGHVRAILASQLPTRAKIPFADQIIRTNAPMEHVRRLLSAPLAELASY